MVSIIIPARNEQFLSHTIKDLLANSKGEIEIIAVLDGYWPPAEEIVQSDKVIYVHKGQSEGMRSAINSAANIAKGKYLMKCDAHCMFAEGFDEALKADCDEDWLVVPRRKRLDAENWTIQDVGKPDVDYNFLSYPLWNPNHFGLHGTIWTERIIARSDPKYDIDEDMSFQGSCWFMHKKLFIDRIYPMQEEGYGTFIGEPQELGLKVWLSGGKQMTNKKTWYAHLHKGNRYGRGYSLPRQETSDGNMYSCNFWMNNKWKDRKYDIGWLVERFWPVKGWPPDWEKKWHEFTKDKS